MGVIITNRKGAVTFGKNEKVRKINKKRLKYGKNRKWDNITIYNVEILRISPNFMDFFYPRFQDSAYVYTPLALKNEDFSSNLTIPLSNFGLSQIFAFETAPFLLFCLIDLNPILD